MYFFQRKILSPDFFHAALNDTRIWSRRHAQVEACFILNGEKGPDYFSPLAKASSRPVCIFAHCRASTISPLAFSWPHCSKVFSCMSVPEQAFLARRPCRTGSVRYTSCFHYSVHISLPAPVQKSTELFPSPYRVYCSPRQLHWWSELRASGNFLLSACLSSLDLNPQARENF